MSFEAGLNSVRLRSVKDETPDDRFEDVDTFEERSFSLTLIGTESATDGSMVLGSCATEFFRSKSILIACYTVPL